MVMKTVAMIKLAINYTIITIRQLTLIAVAKGKP